MGIADSSPFFNKLQLYVDFIVGINDFLNLRDYEKFKEAIRSTQAEVLSFKIYNMISRELRTIQIPNNNQKDLGLQCVFEDKDNISRKILRVVRGIFLQ